MSSQAPRPPHPPPASPAIARVLPMVPELSLFMPGQPRQPSSLSPSHPHQPVPARQHNQLPARQPIHHNLVPQSDPPPRPHLPPSHHLVPQSDFSREFLRSEATLFLSGSTETPVRRVQFQTDNSPGQVRQAGAEHGYQARPINSAVTGHGNQGRPSNPAGAGQVAGHSHSDRLRFPDQVQQLHRYDFGVQDSLEQNTAQHVKPRSYDPNQEQHNPSVNTQNTLPPPAVAPPQIPSSLPPDIMSVLTWQNDQLAKLQDQVARLLAASPQNQAQYAPHPPPGQDAAPQTVVDNHGSPMLKKAPCLSQNTGKVSVSTSTSTLLPDMQPTIEKQMQIRVAGQEERQDGPEYPGTPSCSSSGQQVERGGMNTWDSPVLGESASMYLGNTREKEQENVEMMYENILGQVQKLLAQDKEQYQQEGGTAVVSDQIIGQEQQQHPPTHGNILTLSQQRQEYAPPINSPTQEYSPPTNPPRQEYSHPVQENTYRQDYASPTPRQEYAPSSPPQSRPTHPPRNRGEVLADVSSNTATLDRLRQLGVSFISQSDLAPAPPASNPYNSIFLPKANLPSTTLISPSPDTSLAINNLALKYLSDAELVKLAGHHNKQTRKEPTRQEVRQSAEYSLASHQFLVRHGLGAEQGHGQGERVADGNAQAQRQQPPLLPARPPNSGTEQVIRPAPAVPVLDRVLDITAIRNQSKLG